MAGGCDAREVTGCCGIGVLQLARSLARMEDGGWRMEGGEVAWAGLVVF